MRIDLIEIEHFGKLSHYTLRLDSALQVVLGDNEDGKTTIMEFLRLAFYPSVGRGRDIKNPRQRYQPWSGEAASGAVEFTAGGVAYRLQRVIGTTKAKDKSELIELATGRSIELGKDEEVGKRFFGLDADGFARSSFIGRVGALNSAAKGGDDVAQKLMQNLVTSGEEDVSADQALTNLDAAMKGLVAPRGGGRLDQARRQLDELAQERFAVREEEETQQQYAVQYAELERRAARQREVEALLGAHSAGDRLRKLDDMLVLMDKRDEKQASVRNDAIAQDELPAYVEELRNKRSQYRAAQQALDNLEQAAGEAEAEIPSEAYDEITRLHQSIEGLSALQEKANATLRFSHADCVAGAQTQQKLEADIVRLQAQTEQLAPAREQYAEQSKRAEQLRDTIDQRKRETAARQEAGKQEIHYAQQRMQAAQRRLDEAPQQRSGPNIALLLVGVLLGGASVAGYLLLQQVMSLLALPAGVVLLVLAFVLPKRGANASSRQQAEQELEQAQQDIQQAEQELQSMQQQAETALQGQQRQQEHLAQTLDVLREQDAEYQQAAAQLQRARDEAAFAREKRQQADASYAQHRQYIESDRQRVMELGFALPDVPADPLAFELDAFMQQLDAFRGECQAGQSQKLAALKCKDMQQLNTRYNAQLSNEKNRQAVSQAEQNVHDMWQAWQQQSEQFRLTESVAQAEALLTELDNALTEIENMSTAIRLTASGMGLEVVSREMLNMERGRLAMQPAAEGMDAAQLEALQEEKDMLAGMDIQQGMLRLAEQMHTPERSSIQIEQEMTELEEQAAQMQEYYDALALAHSVMQEARDEMHSSFGPQLNEQTGKILQKLTGDKYTQVLVSMEYGVRVQQGSAYREHEYFSSGTIDQTYLALRLAMSSMISPEADMLPIFMDDVLMQYDDERARHTLAFLKEYAEQSETQITLLTCRRFFADEAARLGANVKAVHEGETQ